MKKIMFSFVVLLISLFVITQQVHAEETNAIITKVNEIQKINGKAYKFKETFIKDVNNYFDIHTLSDSDISIIVDDIDEIIEVYKAAGVSKWINLDEEQKAKVTKNISNIDENTNLHITISEDGVITIYEKTGEEYTKASNLFVEVEEIKEKEEKQYTGNESNMFIIVGGISFAVLLIVTRNVVRSHS